MYSALETVFWAVVEFGTDVNGKVPGMFINSTFFTGSKYLICG
jgi:hypothetical protein